MVKKFFAYYKSDFGIKSVSVYKALSMKNSRINNQDKIIEFWDTPELEDAEKVFPKRSSKDGRAAHFSYYSGSKRAGINSEMTMTHKLYEIIYSETDRLLLDAFGTQVMISIKNAKMEYFYRTSYNFYFIDIMLELEKTKPSLYYYKWNGKLALEIYVTHKVEKSKINDFTENGIQLFQIKIYDNQRVPEDIDGEEQFEYYKRIIKTKVEKNNYKVVGSFLNNVFPESGSSMGERYTILADFEKEKRELQEQILNNKKIIKAQEEQIRNNEASLHILNEKLERMQNELIVNENKLRTADNIFQKNSELTMQHQRDQNIISQLQNNLDKERNEGFLRKLLSKLGR